MINNLSDHLICNGRAPLISSGSLRNELILYNLAPASIGQLCGLFETLTGKKIGEDSDTGILSGGQKVVLMCLLALFSPARKINFLDLFHSLDESNKAAVRKLITELGAGKEISLEGSSDVD